MIGSAIGCVLGLWIQRKLGWNSKQMIMLHLAALMCLAWYALLGVIPGSPIGLVSKGELYVFGLIYALQFGSITSFSRSTFASIVPIGKESAMFALYEVTEKGSSRKKAVRGFEIRSEAVDREHIECSIWHIHGDRSEFDGRNSH